MKSYLIALLAALMATLCTNQATDAAPRRLKGSGNLITKELTLPAFQAVSATRSVKVELVADEGQAIRIEADDNVMEYVVTKVESGGVLKISIDDNIRSISEIHVCVSVPTNGKLQALRAASAAHITSKVRIQHKEVDLSASSAGRIYAQIEAEECDMELSSAARIEAEVVADQCSIEGSSSADILATLAVRDLDIDLSSAADATLKGAALRAEVDLSSAAELNARHLLVKQYDIEASSAADAQICCMERLDAQASSGADITYTGNCSQRSIKRSSGGGIHRR